MCALYKKMYTLIRRNLHSQDASQIGFPAALWMRFSAKKLLTLCGAAVRGVSFSGRYFLTKLMKGTCLGIPLAIEEGSWVVVSRSSFLSRQMVV